MLFVLRSVEGRFVGRARRCGKFSRRLGALLLVSCVVQTGAGEDARVIASFEKPAALQDWFSVNDNVMGGVSKGGYELTESKTLLFTGDLSLQNNGGFASIRTKPSRLNLAGASGFSVKVRGDGRTYWVGLHTAGQVSASSYRAFLPTTEGAFTETFIPLADFKLQAFGRRLRGGVVDPAAITSIGFTIADKQPGSFMLEIASVKAVFDKPQPSSSTSAGTLVDVATAAGTFNTLLAAAVAADLAAPLSGEGPFTLFAPTDEAFSQLPAGTLEDLLKPESKRQLADILKYHVIAGRTTLAGALDAGEGLTLQGEKLAVTFDAGRVRIGPATLLQADIPASNGIIHVIDQVLLPPAEPVKALTPAELIERAIARGVPLFNSGNAGACAAVYEVACEALLGLPGVPEDSRRELALALTSMQAAHTEEQQAWGLRRALDRVASRGFEVE